jgi:hypothetical protein
MRRSGPRADKGIGAALLVSAALLFAGCLGDVTGEGVEESGSVLRVDAINGFYKDKENSVIQVDVIQDLCESGQGGEPKPEFFSDHFAQALISNNVLPGATYQSASTVYIHSYTVSYQPMNDNSPPLAPYREPLPISDTLVVPPCSPGASCKPTTTGPLKFMDMAKKSEFLDGVCGSRPALADCPDAPPEENNGCYWLLVQGQCVRVYDPSSLMEGSYIVTYTFYGENVFGKEVSCQGSHHFTVDDYDLCSTGGGG